MTAATRKKVVPATGGTAAPLFEGGFNGLGSDVAVYTLSKPITDISAEGRREPAAEVGRGLRPSRDRLWDPRHPELVGTRKTGSLTLRADRGSPATSRLDVRRVRVEPQDDLRHTVNRSPPTPPLLASIKVAYDGCSFDYEVYVAPVGTAMSRRATATRAVRSSARERPARDLRRRLGRLPSPTVAAAKWQHVRDVRARAPPHDRQGANRRDVRLAKRQADLRKGRAAPT